MGSSYAGHHLLYRFDYAIIATDPQLIVARLSRITRGCSSFIAFTNFQKTKGPVPKAPFLDQPRWMMASRVVGLVAPLDSAQAAISG